MELVLDDEAETLARELAALMGESVEEAVLKALQEKLELLQKHSTRQSG